MNRLFVLASAALLMFATTASAQEWDPQHDTLTAAVKTDSRRVVESLGKLSTGLEGVRRVISPLGEGDPIRWAQGLPGVSTGADGTTAFYVRGGNMGNNLITLDGVPVYGYSHLLGLTTIIPQEAMSETSLLKGGFEGSSSNFTAGHLAITTRDPSREKFRMSAALNNFLASVALETPINEKMSFMLSGRISPLALEYKAVQGMLPDLLGGFDDFGAGVGDLYGKFRWQTGKRSVLNASFLGSMDGYSFVTVTEDEGGIRHRNSEKMGWNNMIGIVSWHVDGERSFMDFRASVNRYTSSQEQHKYYRGVMNDLTLKSSLTEYMFSFDRTESMFKAFKIDYGTKFRIAEFAPGQVASVNNASNTLLGTVYLQGRYDIENRLSARATVRGHFYRNMKDKAIKTAQEKINAGRYDYDASVAVNW
ncbi:MAG: TonB-dependent receptor plug domain-containing protein, partial [Bacteroidales bacterium]|nr:TonB-dependent receptor plug domain-containing protein [Bacteroidales bacterium]